MAIVPVLHCPEGSNQDSKTRQEKRISKGKKTTLIII